MSAKLITSNLGNELEMVLEEFRAGGPIGEPRGLSVGGRKPFGARGLSVGAVQPTGGPMANGAYAANPGGGGAGVDQYCPDGCSGPAAIKKYLDRIGYPPCRVWGAEPPGGRDAIGCPTHKKLCIIPFPIRLSVAADTTVTLEVKAKLWFWPLMIVDAGTEADTLVTDMTFAGDPVLENGTLTPSAGTATRGWSPAQLYPPEGNYSLLPGLPAFDTTQGLVFTIQNTDAANAEVFAISLLGVSIRY